MRRLFTRLWFIPATILLLATSANGQAKFLADSPANLLSNGGFEVATPAYWTSFGEGAEWSTEMYRTPSYSLKLSGTGEASWVQEEAIRNWVPGIPGSGNPEMVAGGWVYTEGVNTSPGSDDEKFQLVFDFFTDATQTENVLGASVVIDVPQDEASTGGWVEITSESLGALTFPGEQAAKSARITVRKGASATGTVYFDDLSLNKVDPAAEGWTGGWFNPNMDAPDTWYYWWDGFDQGRENWPEEQAHILTLTDADAHSGDYSLRIEAGGINQAEVVGITERVPAAPGVPMLLSFWVKHEGNIDPDSIGIGQNNIGATALWYNNLEGGAAGWGEVGGIDIILNGQFINPQLVPLHSQTESSGWTQYAFVFYPVTEAVGIEVRLRYWHAFSGVTYWDDVFLAPVEDVVESLAGMNLLHNPGFENLAPAYWEASGDGAEWSDEMYRTPGRSLKLSGSGEASWSQTEAIRNWVPGIPGSGNPEMVAGGWVYTEGVNTSPASDDEKFQLIYDFFTDATQTENVLGESVVIDVPQDQASSGGWVEITSEALGALTFPGEQAAKSARITLRKGANATGAVYFDDLSLNKVDPAAEGWTGGWFNPNMDAPDLWYYWWDGFDQGRENWPEEQAHILTISDEDANTGDYSLKIMAGGDNQAEVVGISERVPVTPGEPVLLSFNLRHEGNTREDSIGIGQNNLGATFLWYNNLEGGAAGWGEIGGADVYLNGADNPQFIPKLAVDPPGKTEGSDWTHYAFVGYPLTDAVGLEVRLRYWHAFNGASYWDDVAIIPLGGSALQVATATEDVSSSIPRTFSLHQNYPNPFNPTTSIAFDLTAAQEVSLEVFNVLGQRVETILNATELPAGRHAVDFSAHGLPSGLYLYRIATESGSATRKMVLLK